VCEAASRRFHGLPLGLFYLKDNIILIIGNKNAITYKEVFPLIRDNRLWVGVTPMGRDLLFGIPDDRAAALQATGREGSAWRMVGSAVMGRAQAVWFSNLPHSKRNEELVLWKTYSPEEFPAYDNYDAIEVSKVAHIPADYPGAMGVPITFLDKYNPEQFELIGNERTVGKSRFVLSGRQLYARLLIRNRHPQTAG